MVSMHYMAEATKSSFLLSVFQEKFRVSRTREALDYHESSDTRVATVGITVRTGRKFRAEAGLELTESQTAVNHMTWLILEEVTAGVKDVAQLGDVN